MRFLGAVARQFSIGMACDQLWLFHCINIRRVFGSSLNPRPRAQQLSPASASNNTIMVDPFNMYLKMFIEENASLSQISQHLL